MSIHPTAIVHTRAQLDPSVEVGPYAVIDAHVHLGAGCIVGPHAYLTGRLVAGPGNQFSSGAKIGVPSQDLKHEADRIGRIEIGAHNQFREFVTVSASTLGGADEEERVTRIGSGGLFMACSHVAHDCTVGDRVIMANSAALSGHVTVEDGAILGGLTGVHQFTRIGRLAFIGGMSRINQDVLPFMLVEGNPAKCHGPNSVGLERAGLDTEARRGIKACYRLLCRSGLNVTQALAAIEAQVPDTPERAHLLAFIRASSRGITR